MAQARTGREDPLGEARRTNNLAAVLSVAGEDAQALELFSRARELFQAALPEGHWRIAAPLNGIAAVHHQRGEYSAAADAFGRAKEALQAALGPYHPTVAVVADNHTNALRKADRYDEAMAATESALQAAVSTFGPHHDSASRLRERMADLHLLAGSCTEARRWAEEAKSGRLENGGDPTLADFRLVDALHCLEDHSVEAEISAATLERVRVAGAKGVTLGFALLKHARGRREAGESSEHAPLLDEAAAALREAEGADGKSVLYVAGERAEGHLAAGRPADAAAILERVIAQREEGEPDAFYLAENRFALARALADAEPERARQLARLALREHERIGSREDRITAIRRWLTNP